MNYIGPFEIRIARERVAEALDEARVRREVLRARERNGAPPRGSAGSSLARRLARLAAPLTGRRSDPCPTC